MVNLLASTAGKSGSALAIRQAGAALRGGNALEAERILRQRLFQSPSDLPVMAKLIDLAIDRGRTDEAVLYLQRFTSLAPGDHCARVSLARLHQQLAEYEQALKQIQLLPLEVRASFDVMALEAALLGQLRRHDSEIVLYERLTELAPDHAPLWMSYGNALKTVGRVNEAVAALRRAIHNRPTFGEAYWSLANLKTFQFNNRDIAAMRRALKSKLEPADELHFHFALGKALEDRQQIAASFQHYQAGNRIGRAQIPEEMTSVTNRVAATIETFDQALFDRLGGSGDLAPDPIFIVGIQRSGSTLVEQILASHPQIEGTAELLEIEQLWRRVGRLGSSSGNPFAELRQLSADDLRSLGAEYLSRTQAYRSSERSYFVDKLPANWLNTGFIRLILPNAKIIDARRHPMACGFSNFKQHYSCGVGFAYDLGSIGQFYRDYVHLMRHFDTVQPGAVHRVINERLIDDPEGEVRRLLEFVGVPYDPACLSFYNNRRAVSTPSAEQVRRPINRDGVDSWRAYERWLSALAHALGPVLQDWDKPT